MAQLDGKVGVITAAASGIGAACARMLVREGAKLLLTELDDAAGHRIAGKTGGVFVRHTSPTKPAGRRRSARPNSSSGDLGKGL